MIFFSGMLILLQFKSAYGRLESEYARALLKDK